MHIATAIVRSATLSLALMLPLVLAPPARADDGPSAGGGAGPRAGQALPLADWGSLAPWPGRALRGRFSGGWVEVALAPGRARYRLMLDGDAVTLDAAAATTVWRGQPDGTGPHELSLDLLNETDEPPPRVTVTPGSALAAPPVPVRRIQVIGDSDSTGFGVRHAGRDCDAETVREATDSTKAWGALVARQTGAALRLNAQSGIGLVRNYDNAGFPPMSRRMAAAPAGRWGAQLIVVALGSNDFEGDAPGAGEPWPDKAALIRDFRAALAALLDDLRAREPGARILLLNWRNYDPALIAALQSARQARRDQGDGAVDVLILPAMRRDACLWHPSERDHQRTARAVLDYIDRSAAFEP